MSNSPTTVKKRILFVDRSTGFTHFAGLRLMREHPEFEVHAVNDALMALETVREFKPHMIFINLDMGELTGYDVATQIKAVPCFNALPIHFLSDSLPRDLQPSPEILDKPLSIDHLVHSIRERLGQ